MIVAQGTLASMERWQDRVTDAVQSAETKREACEVIGVNGTLLHSHIHQRRPDLSDKWRSLPAAGCFSDSSMEPPGPVSDQSVMDELVENACKIATPEPSVTQVRNCVRLMLAMYRVAGSLNWHRGWVRAVMLAFEAHDCKVPTSRNLRWYRCRLATEPDLVRAERYGDGFEGEIERIYANAYG